MNEVLSQIQNVIDSRKGAEPESSYVAQLLHKGEDKILKKVIEEAGEVLMASKDGGGEHLIYEAADLWFHNPKNRILMKQLLHACIQPGFHFHMKKIISQHSTFHHTDIHTTTFNRRFSTHNTFSVGGDQRDLRPLMAVMIEQDPRPDQRSDDRKDPHR